MNILVGTLEIAITDGISLLYLHARRSGRSINLYADDTHRGFGVDKERGSAQVRCGRLVLDVAGRLPAAA